LIDGIAVVKRYERLKGERYNFDNRWERMAAFISPSRQGIIAKYAQGVKQTDQLYDSTTLMAAELMAHFLAGNTINPGQRWVSFVSDDPVAQEDDEIQEWNEECRDRYLQALRRSQFYAEGPESLIDYGGFGTGCLLQEEAPQPPNFTLQGFRGFYFRAEKIGRFVIAEGGDGLVDTAFREFAYTPRVANDLWGPDSRNPLAFGLSEKLKGKLKGADVDKNVPFIHAIYPRPRAEQGAGARGMPWVSCWIELETKHVCYEGGYLVFPIAVPRYQKTPGEVYGRGRGDIAFPDTFTLNTAKRMGFQDWALKIQPPILYKHNSVIGSLKLVPAGATPVNTMGQSIKDVMMPYESGSHPEVSHLNEEELRKSIRQIFFIDHILKLLETEKSEMTAFEFQKKLQLLFKLIGPVYGRLEYEFLHKLVDVGWTTMFNAGAFSPPPASIYRTNRDVKLVFENPIARSQRAEDVEGLSMAINDLAPLGQVFPQMFDWLDPDKTTLGVFRDRGVAAKWTRSLEQVETLRTARHQQNIQEQQAQQVAQFAESAGKVAPLVKVLSEQGAS
jgi:hypothetical protein